MTDLSPWWHRTRKTWVPQTEECLLKMGMNLAKLRSLTEQGLIVPEKVLKQWCYSIAPGTPPLSLTRIVAAERLAFYKHYGKVTNPVANRKPPVDPEMILDALTRPMTLNDIWRKLGVGQDRLERAIRALVATGRVETIPRRGGMAYRRA